MKKMYFILLLFTSWSCVEEKLSSKQKRETIETILEEYNACQKTATTGHSCKNFTARAICEYYGIDDLKKDGKYVEYSEIHTIITTHPKWKNLGMATEQEVLENAQSQANKGYAVVAINTTKTGHYLAVPIIEGGLSSSNSWHLNVPNCAAFFPKNAPETFINKSLNYVWSNNKNIQLWVRK